MTDSGRSKTSRDKVRAHRQSASVATSRFEAEDQAFINSISALDDQ